jgi:hypothetical protein
MKSIELYTASVNNAGRRVDAGATVTIGDEPEQISGARAQDLVDRGGAVAEAAPARPTKAASPDA